MKHENQYLKSQAKETNRAHLIDLEKIRRLNDLLSQAREDASTTDKLHHQELNSLYRKISSFQVQHNTLNDEQILAEMRSLNQKLDLWVKYNFNDVRRLSALNCSEPGGQFPRSSTQRWAWIQGTITEMIFHYIFSPQHFGLDDNPWSQFLQYIEDGVEQAHSAVIQQNWRGVTCDAIEQSTRDVRESLMMEIITSVEEQFAEYSPMEETPRKRQLGELLQRCATFKDALSRQKDLFHFFRSQPGDDFSMTSMTFAGGCGDLAAKVRICLWPGLAKRTQNTTGCTFEPELVWTVH